MPNKRNPDAAELVRGHSARIVGDLVALLMLLKGLPLAYAKDLQDDKPPLFDAHDLLAVSLAAMAGMVAELEFDAERMRAAAAAGHATATDLADWLAGEADVPFREAHHIAGRAVAAGRAQGRRPRPARASTICARSTRASARRRWRGCRSRQRRGAHARLAERRRTG